ncbi:hypothetical protein C0J52_02704 [Blattella germanica]|nr:hypothetical protein C0J52_02704 [Blattella germanica]
MEINCLNGDLRHSCRACMNMKMMYTFLVMCLAASWEYAVIAQKTGEICSLTHGVTGVCKPIEQCADAVDKAFNGQGPAFCNFDSELPIVCCAKTQVQLNPLNDQSRQKSGRQNDFIFMPSDPHTHRYPWWMAENPFSKKALSASAQLEGPSNSGPSHENLDRPWWFEERPFIQRKPAVLPPTIPPSPPRQTPRPTRQTPPPVTRPTTSTTRKRHPQFSQRISEEKCEEYSKLAVEPAIALPLVPTPDPVRIDIPKCDFSSLELIAALGYQVGANIEWKCGGTLISDFYVLTAAHCTPTKSPPRLARLGELNLKRNDDGAEPRNYLIVDIKRHPEYKPPAKYNDIALLKLDRRVEFNDFIRPACLYTRDDFTEKKSDNLLKVAISIIDNKVCNSLYELDGASRELSKGIIHSMMCAGELAGGKDTCQGDSGGPIQITRPNNQCVYSIIGITSFGKFCAAKNSPGVYTRVSSFIPWIEDVVWPDS